jgi:hypothetical protein
VGAALKLIQDVNGSDWSILETSAHEDNDVELADMALGIFQSWYEFSEPNKGIYVSDGSLGLTADLSQVATPGNLCAAAGIAIMDHMAADFADLDLEEIMYRLGLAWNFAATARTLNTAIITSFLERSAARRSAASSRMMAKFGAASCPYTCATQTSIRRFGRAVTPYARQSSPTTVRLLLRRKTPRANSTELELNMHRWSFELRRIMKVLEAQDN